MKICLSNNLTMDGYLNLQTANLGEYCFDSQCEELIVDKVLEYVNVESITEILKHWVSKLRHKGKLIIMGNDLIEISKNILNKNLLVPNANALIFGNGKRSILTLDDITSLLTELGLKIKSRQLIGMEFTIEAFRP